MPPSGCNKHGTFQHCANIISLWISNPHQQQLSRRNVHMTEVISHRWKPACKPEPQMMILFMFSSRMRRPGWLESVYGGQTLCILGKYLFKARDDPTPSGLGVRLQQRQRHRVGILSSRDKCLLTSVHDTSLESRFSSPSSSLYIQVLAIHILL